jgi:hypothetical protein
MKSSTAVSEVIYPFERRHPAHDATVLARVDALARYLNRRENCRFLRPRGNVSIQVLRIRGAGPFNHLVHYVSSDHPGVLCDLARR